MSQDLDLRNLIVGARDVPQAGEACRKVATELGFEYFLYGLRVAVSRAHPCQFVLSGYPKGWRTLYDERGYLMADPVLARGAMSVLPFGWDELDRSRPVTQHLFDDAARFGLKHGMTVPVHGLNGEFGLMSFAREAPLPHGNARARLFQRAQWLVSNIQERMRTLIMEDEAVQRSRLTAIEMPG